MNAKQGKMIEKYVKRLFKESPFPSLQLEDFCHLIFLDCSCHNRSTDLPITASQLSMPQNKCTELPVTSRQPSLPQMKSTDLPISAR